MNDELRNRIQKIFDRIEGGSTEDMYRLIDIAIDDGEITQQEWVDNEMAICDFFDTHWFYCTQCGWTLPISEAGQDTESGELACRDCSPEDE